MRKLKIYIAAAFLILLAGFGYPTPARASAETAEYYIGGMAAGFTLSAGGTEIIGLNEVVTEEGVIRPATDVGLQIGDCICAVDGIRIKSIADLNAAMERSGGKEVTLTVKRAGETAEVRITPVKDKKSGKYKIGILIRDTLAGIGTVTYINKSTRRFGALGHAVCDENHNSLEISGAKVFSCSVVG
ncbi:MAG: PDZ domain-containing protein, partial [Clostridia bacterium]|nr:PDZ domain-containing protein [Clostridia bacterium]